MCITFYYQRVYTFLLLKLKVPFIYHLLFLNMKKMKTNMLFSSPNRFVVLLLYEIITAKLYQKNLLSVEETYLITKIF